MKFFDPFFLSFVFSVPVLAGELSVSIEHPRKEERSAFEESIICAKQCLWKSEGKTGAAPSDFFIEEISALNSLVATGKIPAFKSSDPEKVYAVITLKSEEKTTSFKLGLPDQYIGAEGQKFSKLNDHIIKLEFLIAKQRVKK